ncbi:MAG: cytochrome c3 family protein, partial [Desulfuromonadaceae bacterium]
MKALKLFLTCLFLGSLTLAVLTGSASWAERGQARVIPRDCIDCHDEEGQFLATRGAAHQEVGCRGCHVGHPLEGRKPYSDCNECHDPGAKAHYALADCASCHNPHKPLDVDFSALTESKSICLGCHEDPVPAVADNPHAEVGCSECHQLHAEMPQCASCHEPHSTTMVQQDCLGCHPAHAPGSVRLDTSLSTDLCQSCHTEIVQQIKQQGGAHREMGNCGECHAQHPPQTGGIPACADCHGPSDQAHFAVADCSSCHDPHAPLSKALQDMTQVRAACVSCHAGPGQQLQQSPSKHSKQECNACHLKHGEAESCLDCHQGHKASMTVKECQDCHAPHAPIAAEIKTDVPVASCAACH